jgi:hypothetical protein
MARQYGFVSIDASLSPDEVQARIRRRVQMLLEERRMQTLTENMAALKPLLFEEVAAETEAGQRRERVARLEARARQIEQRLDA